MSSYLSTEDKIEDIKLEDKCPSCGGKLRYYEGCVACVNKCGWSRC